MERDRLETPRTREVDRAAPPSDRAETRGADERSILALQRAAGNRAVGALLGRSTQAQAETGRVPFALPVQRQPDGDAEGDRVWSVEWPEETEGERNEPCFDSGFQATILAGADSADRAGAYLSAGPPDLERAVAEMEMAHADWQSVDGSQPGRAALDEAISGIQRVRFAVAAYVLPVSERLEILRSGATEAFGNIADAAVSMTEPESPDEEPSPCFVDEQQAAIQRAAVLANAAGSELDKRPPDYPTALGSLRSAVSSIRAVRGREPGQTSLRSAAKVLDELVIQVGVYLAPVETVVAQAASAATMLAAQARSAADMSRRGTFAAEDETEVRESASGAPSGQGEGSGS